MKHFICMTLILLLGLSVSFAEVPHESPMPDDNGNTEDHAGMLSGCVKVCNRYGEPVDGVQVLADGYGQIAMTDEYGNFEAILPIRNYHLTFLHDYYPTLEVDQIRPIDFDLDIERAPYNFIVQSSDPDIRPECIELVAYLYDMDIPIENFWLSNNGCYPFVYEVSFEVIDGVMNDYNDNSSTSLDDVWDLIRSYPDILTNSGSSDLSGIAMGQAEFYVCSSIDGTLSAFSYNGTFLYQTAIDGSMGGDSLAGILGMANDLEGYLYGGNDRGEIFKFLPDLCEVINVGTMPLIPTTIAYDWDTDYIYASDGDTSFFRMQPDGTPEALAMPYTIPLTGLAYCPLDPDGYTIYAHVNTNPTSILRYNPSTNTWDETPVATIYDLFDDDYAGDIAFCPRGDTSSFLTMFSGGGVTVADRWEGYPNNSWLVIEPASGIINPGEEQLHTITIDPFADDFDYWDDWDGIEAIVHFTGPHGNVASMFVTIYFAWHSNDVEPESGFNITNTPNPFNPSTTIQFDLQKQQNVKLTVFNLMGQEVDRLLDGSLDAGHHAVNFDGSHLASGIYFYRIETPEFSEMKKMVIMK